MAGFPPKKIESRQKIRPRRALPAKTFWIPPEFQSLAGVFLSIFLIRDFLRKSQFCRTAFIWWSWNNTSGKQMCLCVCMIMNYMYSSVMLCLKHLFSFSLTLYITLFLSLLAPCLPFVLFNSVSPLPICALAVQASDHW